MSKLLLIFCVIISYFNICSGTDIYYNISGNSSTDNLNRNNGSIDTNYSNNNNSVSSDKGIDISIDVNNSSSNISSSGRNISQISMNENMTISTIHSRFHANYTAIKDIDLTLLISITSSPSASHLRQAARETWLLPCRAISTCDYRFFIDKDQVNITSALEMESLAHKDMVFRGTWCDHMKRHPAIANYGNVYAKHWVYGGGGYAYYQLRGLYKVDWKICFTKWAKYNKKMAHYHVYVEDDSFVCTENLIHQTNILRNMNTSEKVLPFRTGFSMWDGFDDSSTFMSREITQAFADHYPEGGM